MNVKITAKGLGDVLRVFSDLNAKKEFSDAANIAIIEVRKYAMVEVPVKTGNLQRSHLLNPSTQSTQHAELYTDLEYAVPVHEGHRIVAWGNDTGRSKAPNRWMERAVDRATPEINRVFFEKAEEVTKRFQNNV